MSLFRAKEYPVVLDIDQIFTNRELEVSDTPSTLIFQGKQYEKIHYIPLEGRDLEMPSDFYYRGYASTELIQEKLQILRS